LPLKAVKTGTIVGDDEFYIAFLSRRTTSHRLIRLFPC
jgi:hypothetical protein